jgi:hypothetical protein
MRNTKILLSAAAMFLGLAGFSIFSMNYQPVQAFWLRPQENDFSQFMAQKFKLSEKDIRESMIEYRKNIVLDRLNTLEKEGRINAKQKEELLKLITDLQNKKYELMQRDPLPTREEMRSEIQTYRDALREYIQKEGLKGIFRFGTRKYRF